MAKLNYIQNGLKSAKNGRRRRRRRNGVTAKAATAPKRNGATTAQVKAFAKRNGLKLVSKTVANGKRKRRRRNGIATTVSRSSRNGLLGNTKQDAKRVGYILGGAALTKIASSLASGFIAPYAAQVGLGGYTGIITDAAVALVVAPLVGKKIGGQNGGDMARLGGLLVVGVDVVSMLAPNVLSYTPFNASPVVIQGGSPLVTPQAVSQIVNSTTASAADKAKVAGAMAALAAGVPLSSGSSASVMPVYD